MRVTEGRFERASARAEDEPRPLAGDVVFLGRSNVGKSSLINQLLGVSGLARTSSTPGRTQTINFYRVNRRHFFVDLPGYGYAKAPLAVRRGWRGMIEGFLTRRREAIAAAVVLVDARRGVGELDAMLLAWLSERHIPPIVVGVKADKLGGNARVAAKRQLGLLVSSTTRLGIDALWTQIDAALEAHRKDQRWTSVS